MLSPSLSISLALAWSRVVMRPHFVQTCSRSESFFGTLAPHGQRLAHQRPLSITICIYHNLAVSSGCQAHLSPEGDSPPPCFVIEITWPICATSVPAVPCLEPHRRDPL